MATQGFYKTLGVAPDANEDEIKRAFRKAARKYHPDINKGAGAEAKFKEVNEACEVLKDPGKRTAYGQFGQDLLSDHAHAYSAQDWEQRFGSFGAKPRTGQPSQTFLSKMHSMVHRETFIFECQLLALAVG